MPVSVTITVDTMRQALCSFWAAFHHLVIFFAYGTVAVSVATMFFLWNEPQLTFIDAFFTAVSSFTSTGLAIADISPWRVSSQVGVMLAIEAGSLPLCTSIPSMIRLLQLRFYSEQRHSVASSTAAAVATREKDVIKRHDHVNRVILWAALQYMVGCQVIAVMLIMIVTNHRNIWFASFHVASAFNNAGFALSAASLALPDIASDSVLLIVLGVAIAAGNTLFPVFFRLLLRGWLCVFTRRRCNRTNTHQESELSTASAEAAPHSQVPVVCSHAASSRDVHVVRWYLLGLTEDDMREALEELLSNATAYHTHLFSSKQSMRLLMMWVALTTLDFLMFAPEFNTAAFVSSKNQVIQALFQTVTVRTAGFAVMDFAQVELGHIVFWILSMYLSAYPFLISEQQASEEEDQFRDVAALVENIRDKAAAEATREIGWLYLACIVVMYAEGGSLASPIGDISSRFLRIMFELSSAYGTVGLSLSSPTHPNVSFSGSLSVFSQSVITLVMVFGKLRGLPMAVCVDIPRDSQPGPLPTVVVDAEAPNR